MTDDSSIITLKDHPLSIIINDLLNETNNQELYLTIRNIRTLINIILKLLPPEKIQSIKDYQLLANYMKNGKKLSAIYDQSSFPDLFKIYNAEAVNKLFTIEVKFIIFLCHMIDSIKDIKDFCINKEGLFLIFKNPIYFYSALFPDKQTYFDEEVLKYDTSVSYKEEVTEWINNYLEWFLVCNKLVKEETIKLPFKKLLFNKIFELADANIKDTYSSIEAKEVFEAFLLLIKSNWPNEIHKIKIACNLSEEEYSNILTWYRYNSSVKRFNELSTDSQKDYEFSDNISDIEDFLKKETKMTTVQMSLQKITLPPETRNVVDNVTQVIKPDLNHTMAVAPKIIKPVNDNMISDELLHQYWEEKTQVEVHYYNLKKSKNVLIASGTIEKINTMGIMLKLDNGASTVLYRSDIKQIIPEEDLKVTISNLRNTNKLLEEKLLKLEERFVKLEERILHENV